MADSTSPNLRFYLANRTAASRFWLVLRHAFVGCYKNNVLGTAKGAAYSGLLSLFPMLTAVTAILVQANARAVSNSLASFVFEAVPPGTQEILAYNFTQRGQRPAYLLITATLLAAWAASGVMMSLMQGFQAAYDTPGRNFWRHRGIALWLVMCSAVPVIVASALIVTGTRLENWLLQKFVIGDVESARGWLALIATNLRYLIALISIAVGTSCLYMFGPNRRMSWRQVWRGAVIATLFYWIVTTAFGWYVRNMADYNVLYGSIGTVVALLVWMYLLSIIALLGCEYNAARERLNAAGLL